jgi:transcriptional regulator with XRE-family HTH domain
MVNSTEFGERLQKILDFYGISAAELSKQISVNRSTFSHLLSGRNKPSLDFIMKILQKYPEVELYWLLNGKGTFPLEINENQSNLRIQEELSKKDDFTGKKKKQPINTDLLAKNLNEEEIERIIIFFKDGSFKSFKN